jgi:2-keto-3-deoxy-L-rhamnonate aldolase RhmA
VKAGEILIGGQILDSRSSAVVEVYHDAGFDFVLVDREHTALNDETIADHVRVARCLGFPCLVRVVEDCYHEMNRVLDQGCDGIFVPRITTREQVERVVHTVSYRPKGIRGFCGSSSPIGKYAGWQSIPEQMEAVTANTVVGIQIETREALEHVDDVLSVGGVDIAVVGNDDLTVSLGIPGQAREPEYVAIVEWVVSACKQHCVMPGIAVGDPETAVFWIRKGMKFIWYSTDVYLLHAACTRELGEIRKRLSEAR